MDLLDKITATVDESHYKLFVDEIIKPDYGCLSYVEDHNELIFKLPKSKYKMLCELMVPGYGMEIVENLDRIKEEIETMLKH